MSGKLLTCRVCVLNNTGSLLLQRLEDYVYSNFNSGISAQLILNVQH